MSQSIFDIERNLLSIFEELEENGGEFTPELEEKLKLNGQEVTRKVKSYVGYIQKLNSDMAAIKAEQDRLDKLTKIKQKTVENVSNLVLYAIDKFGTEDKKGKKFFDWGTGKVSTRKSTSVEVDSKKINSLTNIIQMTFTDAIYTGMIRQTNSIDEDAILDACEHNMRNDQYQSPDPIEVETEDIDDITVDVTIPVPMRSLISGEGYQLMSKVADVNPNAWKFKPTIDKKAMKVKLTDEGGTSNIAKVVTKENLSIK
uniref:Resistance protein n=1 Tax=Geladintestivirus 4 TaxID=3233136 RepID=A0AAU8MH28_9CAUD